MHTRCLRLALLFALAAIASTKPLQSQEWPQRPVKIIVPYAVGGNSDEIGRVIARHLSDAFGQPFVVENRPGASGAIAAEAVARSPADGYTLFLASLPQIAIMPAAIKTSFDPLMDVVPISAVATNPLALVVNPSLPVHSVAEFVGYTRERKGQVTYAAVGVAGTTRLAMTIFLKRAEIEMMPVFYKGGAPAVTDLIAGHVNAHFAIASIVMPYATGDMLRFLAVSSAQRVPQLPNVPTMLESGYAGFKLSSWVGLMAPAGIPKEIVGRIAREASRAVKAPKTAALLTASGIDPLGSSPEEFAAMIATDIPLWAEAVKFAGVLEK
jgi:tripartite-type tricarboxylate transporter receptor subunit TctC